ncbi:ELM1/GtrOC1 family putative glycosyltransferase [Campylobacter hyointestinalis]|uniref:ELM1/GtrOC1 family putative glycosyltransferase n=1 Tax=Campylobacter hyointestinalis TaxID=198 RepID=UPI000CE3D356|nr:ELM1/GtrOC1 family putative glycosyltransferase [Campylobacter hyointestinalis]MBT0612540.1 mitochondrial fission ELM1 family protein [Campylobacter hyointestinalis subsp. hyointestinalis]PPB73826.1 hypothetical protein CDQ79_02715 [Campylobacter hyointestinalis subsp. hyointestinalis]PPB75427.1 hypothetical protein CDQ80_02700 [Campylobacter hyointestinalis subsp. hyointestinalis]PPB77087.1 hypothetical protein CDQ81_04510 [Campylobacter hyointestinalis subsp. hyointestinalis]PPB79180.1 hy
MNKALILSDARVGHENQSIAFCKYLNLDYEIIKISFKNRWLKAISYVFDLLGLKFKIFTSQIPTKNSYDVVVSAGSNTYYALKYYAKKLNAKSVAMMNVKGYKNDFDLMFVMSHDYKKNLKNAVLVPVNLNYPSKNHFYTPTKKAIAFIIGGTNRNFDFDENSVFDEIKTICDKFPNYEKLITTSPRTPKKLEDKLMGLNFDFSVFYSQNKINPIGDFLEFCDYVFITSDSTSMISEAVCNGKANIEIINYSPSKKENKYHKFIQNLETSGFLHVYNGDISNNSLKFDISKALKEVKL